MRKDSTELFESSVQGTGRVASSPGSLLEAVESALTRCAAHQAGVEDAPAAVLWTDGEAQWQPLLPVLRRRMPQLLTLGAFDPAIRQGPAIWIRAVLAGELSEPAIPEGTTPIVCLPAVSRHELRAGEECPILLQPLVDWLAEQEKSLLAQLQNGPIVVA
jgi:hypothetical protein